jgi:hypothetical protein
MVGHNWRRVNKVGISAGFAETARTDKHFLAGLR